ncbi:hypothetical protein J4X29_13515 [Escherichia coli]
MKRNDKILHNEGLN